MEIYVLIHGEGRFEDYDESVLGVYSSRDLAETNAHHEKQLVSSSTVQISKKRTVEKKEYENIVSKCCSIEEFTLDE